MVDFPTAAKNVDKHNSHLCRYHPICQLFQVVSLWEDNLTWKSMILNVRWVVSKKEYQKL